MTYRCRNLGNDLDGARPRSDDRHALIVEDHVVAPFRGVHDWAGEAFDTFDIGEPGFGESASREDDVASFSDSVLGGNPPES